MGQKIKRCAFVAGKNLGQRNSVLISLSEPKSKWFTTNKQDMRDFVYDDFIIRKFISKEARDALISKIFISRGHDKSASISVYVAKSALLLGKIDKMKKLGEALQKITKFGARLSVVSVKKPELDASVVGVTIAYAIESTKSYKKGIKLAMSSAMKSGAKGIKVMISGRINGAEIARSEKFAEGSVPLSTLRADIDYVCEKAITKYGVIGIQVWINR